MMNARRWICVFALTVLAGPAFAQQSAPLDVARGVQSENRGTAAGRIKLASGEVFVLRGGNSVPALVGQEVYESDSLRTGSDGRLGVTLKDDTRVSLGPGSEVRLNSFLFTPAEGKLALVLNFVRGMAVYVSGKIAKLAPDSIRLETPGAIVGVRGTTVAIQVVQ
jgi:hypothetical protein